MAEEGTTQKKEEVPTYTVDRLVAEAQDFLGEPPHVVAGALSAGTKKNYTIDQAQKAIKDFKAHEVEVDNPLPQRAGEEE